MLGPAWAAIQVEEPRAAAHPGRAATRPPGWHPRQEAVDRWFELEDPTRLEPAEREAFVECLLDSGLMLRGVIDRIDVAPDGAVRVVDYKTGSSPAEGLRGPGAVPAEVLRTDDLAHPRCDPQGHPAGLPRRQPDRVLRARRGRPARHRAQGPGDLGGDPGGARDRGLPAEPGPQLRLVRPPRPVPGLRRHAAADPAPPAAHSRPPAGSVSGPGSDEVGERRQADVGQRRARTCAVAPGATSTWFSTTRTGQPAASADVAPVLESSMATQSPGASPRAAAAVR